MFSLPTSVDVDLDQNSITMLQKVLDFNESQNNIFKILNLDQQRSKFYSITLKPILEIPFSPAHNT